jgi:hypothetical protein
MRASVDHVEKRGVELFCRESLASTSAMAPGSAATINVAITALSKLFLFLLPKTKIQVSVIRGGRTLPAPQYQGRKFDPKSIVRPAVPVAGEVSAAAAESVPLIRLAWGRSGDKGNLFNVAIIARRPAFLPFIRAALSAEVVGGWFRHLYPPDVAPKVDVFVVPGCSAINFVLRDSMDGGILISPRVDNAAKGMAQQLLEYPVRVPRALLDQ